LASPRSSSRAGLPPASSSLAMPPSPDGSKVSLRPSSLSSPSSSSDGDRHEARLSSDDGGGAVIVSRSLLSPVAAIVPGRVIGLSPDWSEVSPTTVIVFVVVRRPPAVPTMMAVARSSRAGRREQVVAPCVPCRVDAGVVGGGRRAPVKWGRGKAKGHR